ncbi:IucA/IucC family siderophore biosynthesis protein [Bacillus canaveralius]|uniref:IucA/IucC family siderophore biosynthesis protein n=1 Tax=Bacillus canaveralius TaxID=1403243 RepID=A0A2N5GKG9_9BACI|nr:IucA/IucC family protein [Bacillus canaveralius]PLR82023.1 IucA/IucC family siderophore biosynthesis protein [Bacillus canaveralius]PLR99409.1 IucA/IucC family siderophore biosynthesis protein [Bacillus canaveralius]
MATLSYSYKDKALLIDEVKERIMRQTLEALFFEDIIKATKTGTDWFFNGKSAKGDIIHYSCKADVKWSFGRIKIEKKSIKREGEEFTNLYLFLEEIIQNNVTGSYTSQFIHELLETLVKDHQSKQFQVDQIPEQDKYYEVLESHMVDGHPYHPSYKSRIGFSLADNFDYGPEFNQEVSIYWVAVNEQLIDVNTLKKMSFEEIIKHHVTNEDKYRFLQVLKEKGCEEKNYVFLPAHPWQLENKILSLFVQQLIDKDIVILGTANSTYRVQQSIRSLSHRENAEAPYIKFPLSITNTSTSRILAHHTTQNAPLISDWLNKIIQDDSLLKKEKFQILREVMGISFRYDKLNPIQYDMTYGTLGAIFRENVSTYLEDNEEAWPLNALSHTQKNGEPFIKAAIEQYGVEAWSEALIKVVTFPIIHLLFAHGIALESHAQNIILVVENNFPKRMIIKDLHDGVRYTPDQLLKPDWEPKLNPEPESHRKFNRYSFIQAKDAAEVRDYTYDAFFFICMTEICYTFEKFGLSEIDFWSRCVKTIAAYQHDHPEFKERFEMFNLFSEAALIEEMTKRRIYGDGQLYFRKTKNPLLLTWSEMNGKK